MQAKPPEGDPASSARGPVLNYLPLRSGKTVTIARCADAGEAELICGELHAAGVPAAAVNHHTAALGPYSGGSQIEVQVPVEDRDRAAEVLASLPDRGDVEPEPEPPDGSADVATDEEGNPMALAVAAEYATAQEMLEASAALGSARVQSYLPKLVPRRSNVEGPPPVFRVRVAEADLGRAREVLDETVDPDEPRCPRCASWRVERRGRGLWAWLLGIFSGAGAADGVGEMECIRCRHRFTWGNPKGTFEVVVGGDEANQPPAPPPATRR